MIFIDSGAGFTDGSGTNVKALDVVEYRYGKRRGILLEALQDGDAYVAFRDTKKIETVKWKDLCRVPEFSSIDEITGNPLNEFKPTHTHRNGNHYEVVYAKANLQASTGSVSEETPVVVYVNKHGDVWVRSKQEFEDGRFERVRQ